MNLVLKNATIIDRESPFNNKTMDIHVVDGLIKAIGTNLLPQHAEVIELSNLHVSQGWFDSSVSFGEPGFEERETIENGLHTAAKSGFTDIALQPSNYPVTDNQSLVHFALSKASQHAVSLHPIGALTKNSEGKDLAELFDMKNAGAIAFGDYAKSLNSNVLKIALQYVQDFDGTVIAFSQDDAIKGHGVANEGAVATGLGLKGIPPLAEELHVARNLQLLEYTGGKLHIPTISTAAAVGLIRQAKQKGLNVSCSVSVHHLVLTDEKLQTFNSNFKVSPPLRTDQDRQALINAVNDGTIDMITSDHLPVDIEHKKLEFDLAKDGTIGLESAFRALMTVLPVETVVEKLTAARKIFDIGSTAINENTPANLSLFDPTRKSTFKESDILSKSKNSAFTGTAVKGKVYGIINNGKIVINQN